MIAFLLIPAFVMAGDLPLPKEVAAKAVVIKSDRDGLWEKTLVVRFPNIRRMLSTNDGLINGTVAANHAAHPKLWQKVDEELKTSYETGDKIYMKEIKGNIAGTYNVRIEDVALMATAADMDNLAIVTKTFGPFVVTALVTAGAETNAIRTGVDKGSYIEPYSHAQDRKQSAGPKSGTINVMLLTNACITSGGMARAIITATEAKTAALEDLHVPSSYTKTVQATGTGTDTMIIVSGTVGPLVTYTGGHSKIGELIGTAVHEAVLEALEKQNGFTIKH